MQAKIKIEQIKKDINNTNEKATNPETQRSAAGGCILAISERLVTSTLHVVLGRQITSFRLST